MEHSTLKGMFVLFIEEWVIFDKKIKILILLGYKVFEVTLRTDNAFDVI